MANYDNLYLMILIIMVYKKIKESIYVFITNYNKKRKRHLICYEYCVTLSLPIYNLCN